jgi:hypothetical protein
VETIELVNEFVLTYTSPRPCVVDVRLAVLTYKLVPRPFTVDVIDALLTYFVFPRP